jgi:protein-tyrosine phosphatase
MNSHPNPDLARRSLMLDGALNMRDFGGYATADGRAVTRGQLFRSGSLANLSPAARQSFAELGITLICDLRRDEERRSAPTPEFPHAPRHLAIPMLTGSPERMRALLKGDGVTLAERIDFMVQGNRDLAVKHREDYGRMFAALLDHEEGGFLVHCTAGKDRTGFACALVLHALGVPEDTIMADYLLTNHALDIEGYMIPLARSHGHVIPEDREELMALLGVREEYLRAALDSILEEFASVEAYLERAIGLDGAAREWLQRRYVESA